jgi:hypothetical protein
VRWKKVRPIADWPGHACRSKVSLTIATHGAPARSESGNARPALQGNHSRVGDGLDAGDGTEPFPESREELHGLLLAIAGELRRSVVKAMAD